MGETEKQEKRNRILVILVGIVLVFAAVVFAIRDGNIFGGGKVILSEEYVGEFKEYNDLSAEEYENLIGEEKSFVLFVDQNGCNTAVILKGFVEDWAREAGVKVQKIMFSEMRETTLHELVKYYPSVVIINRGKVKAFLRADEDEDAEIYNHYLVFKDWMEQYI